MINPRMELARSITAAQSRTDQPRQDGSTGRVAAIAFGELSYPNLAQNRLELDDDPSKAPR